MGWFALAVISFVFFGAQNYFYKVIALRGLNTRAVTLAYVSVSTLVVWLIIWLRPQPLAFSQRIFWLGFFDAVFYYLTTVTRIESLRFLPTSLAFPMARMSTFIVVLYAIFVWGEAFTWPLGLALVLLLLVLLSVHSERAADMKLWPDYRIGMILSIVSLITSAGTNIMSKLAAENGDIVLYMAIANSMIIMISAGETSWKRSIPKAAWNRTVFALGALIAVTNLLAWFAYLSALKTGPLGVVVTISSMSFVVPIVLSSLFHQEVLSRRRLTAIALTALALVLLHFHV